MANIELWSGLGDLQMERQLSPILNEFARYQPVRIDREPGTIDMPRYRFVSALARRCRDESRGQVNLDRALTTAFQLNRPGEPGANQNNQKIILFEDDLFTPSLNWCFGMYSYRGGHDVVALSTYRMQSFAHFQDLLAHELGHMYGAAPQGRTNTIESLGPHCNNQLCVMQQKLTVSDSLAHVDLRRRMRAPFFCTQCQEDLHRNGRR